MIRRLVSFAGVAALALVITGVALADPPTRVFLPQGSFSGGFCPGFDVLVTAPVDKEYGIFFSNGAVIVTGRLVYEFTNLSTGKTIDINSSGPSKISADGSTVTLFGETVVGDLGGFRYPGSPPDLQLVSGMVVADQTGISETGHVTDLCTALA